MTKYAIVRESFWVGNGCDCCDDTDIGRVTIEVDGETLSFTANDGCNDYQAELGFCDELNAVLYLLENVLGVNVELEDRTEYDE